MNCWQSSIAIVVSISILLSQLKNTNNPEALHLLGVLSLLPDGLSSWAGRISQIGLGFTRVHHLVCVLLQTSLCFLQGETLKVLSPIRHHILSHNPTAIRHVGDLERYYWILIRDQSKTNLGPGFIEARNILDSEMGNIGNLVKNAIRDHPSLDVVEVTIDLSWYFSMTIRLIKIGEHTKHHADRCSQSLGKILRLQSRYEEATAVLNEARVQLTETGDILGATRCSQRLGDILFTQNQYDKATDVLWEARAKFVEIGIVLCAAQCSQFLDDILYMQKQFDKATTELKEAQVHRYW